MNWHAVGPCSRRRPPSARCRPRSSRAPRRELDGLRSRRSVRLALGVSGIGRRLATALRSVRGGGRRSGGGAATAGATRSEERDEAADAVDPQRFREDHSSRWLAASASKPLHVAIVGGYSSPDLDRGSDFARLARQPPRALRARAGPTLDPSVDVVVVGSDVFDIRDLPARPGDDRMAGRRARTLARPAVVRRVRHRPRHDGRDRRPRPRAQREGCDSPAGRSAEAAARRVRDALRRWASSTHYGLRVGVPKWDVTERWGDYHFARALQRSLERSGHPTRVHFRPAWEGAVAARDDVAVHILGLEEAPIRPNQVNILWQISHPDLATPGPLRPLRPRLRRVGPIRRADGGLCARAGDPAPPGHRPRALQARPDRSAS